MLFKQFQVPQAPLLVSMVCDSANRQKAVYASPVGFHSIDLDTEVQRDLFIPVPVSEHRLSRSHSFILPSVTITLLHPPICHNHSFILPSVTITLLHPPICHNHTPSSSHLSQPHSFILPSVTTTLLHPPICHNHTPTSSHLSQPHSFILHCFISNMNFCVESKSKSPRHLELAFKERKDCITPLLQ